MWVLLAAAVAAAVILVRAKRQGPCLIDTLGLGLVYTYARLWHRWSSNGPAPVPAKGPAILVSNHTCSADPSFLTAGCPRVLSFVLAQEYCDLPPLGRLFNYMRCVPVTRNGHDTRAVRLALRRLNEGRLLCIFPEGDLGNAGRRTALHAAKKGIAFLALHSRAPVYPARIVGGPQTSNLLRSWLWPSRVRVIYGPALDLSPYYDRPIDRRLLDHVTRFIMRRIATLEAPPTTWEDRHE